MDESGASRLNRRRCGYIRESEFLKHKEEWGLRVENAIPECMEVIQQRLENISPSPLDFCIPFERGSATPRDIRPLDFRELINRAYSVRSSAYKPFPNIGIGSSDYKDFPYTFEATHDKQWGWCALFAADCAVELVDAVYQGTLDNGFGVISMPGPYGRYAIEIGCCDYNNATVAARRLIDNRGAERILIVDLHLHHNRATQIDFYEDSRVLYFSVHKYHGDGEWCDWEWSRTRLGDFDHIGSGKGVGFNINIPLYEEGMGDAEYMAIFQQILLPVAFEFNPEIIIVTTGFDTTIDWFEVGMRVTPAAHGHMIHALSCLAGGKLVVIVEGDYFPESSADAAVCSIDALLGIPPHPLPPLSAPHPM